MNKRIQIIMAGLAGKPKEEKETEAEDMDESEGSPELDSYAEDLITGVKSDDTAKVIEALRCLIDAMKG